MPKAMGSEPMKREIESQKKEEIETAQVQFRTSMGNAHRAWSAQDLNACDAELERAQRANPHCDVVNRLRAKVHSRAGRLDDALKDAGRALADSPANPRNHHAFAMASHQKGMLNEAGTAYLSSFSRGMPGSSDENGFNGFLTTVRRRRHYFDDVRPAHRKSLNGGLDLARSPSRSSIFDPHRALDAGPVADEEVEVPDPPQLHFISAETNSVTVGWYPDTSGEGENVTIYGYELQIAQHDVRWEGDKFFDDYGLFEQVHRGGADIMEATVPGLRMENTVLCRIRANSFGGFSEWNELVVHTKPPASRQTEALALPRKWLQTDIADLVPLHMLEVGGEPTRFFLEIASCFAPHVRTIRRLFSGWSRVGMVGQKARVNEVSRQQFMRFAKEVGLCQGGGNMCKRSGAKLLSSNDVDRIFMRANTDSRESDKSGTRGGWSDPVFRLDQDKITKVSEVALDELLATGVVEADAGETELREKLRPLFEKYDEDGSGSVSTVEVGNMATSLGMEMSEEELEQLMVEADPDGSGEIEFDELIAVLKKQLRDGGGSMAALFDVKAETDDDGGKASMVQIEFIHALIRLAWECYPTANTGIGARLNALLERAVLPGSSHLTESSDPMEAELSSKRVQAITSYYNDDLKTVFRTFAVSDQGIAGQGHLETMSFAELVFMVKQSELIDGNLTVAGLTSIFAQVNNQAADDGVKDDDGDELSFPEFKNCICRIANAKIPVSNRGGEPFEHTWHAFLQILFLPRMKAVMKEMKKGIRRKSLS